jgi:hypothetical protein
MDAVDDADRDELGLCDAEDEDVNEASWLGVAELVLERVCVRLPEDVRLDDGVELCVVSWVGEGEAVPVIDADWLAVAETLSVLLWLGVAVGVRPVVTVCVAVMVGLHDCVRVFDCDAVSDDVWDAVLERDAVWVGVRLGEGDWERVAVSEGVGVSDGVKVSEAVVLCDAEGA